MAKLIVDGASLAGLVTIGGTVPSSGGGLSDASSDGKSYARQDGAWVETTADNVSSVTFGFVEDGLEALDAFRPFTILDTSASFLANTWQTIWTRTLAEGQVGELVVRNSLISTGSGMTAGCSQLRLFSCYRRVWGGIAAAATGSLGSQTQGIAGANMQLAVSGNDVYLQMRFTNAGTYTYRIPIYIHERMLPA